MDDFPISGLAINQLLEAEFAAKGDGVMPSEEEQAAIKKLWFELRRAIDHVNYFDHFQTYRGIPIFRTDGADGR